MPRRPKAQTWKEDAQHEAAVDKLHTKVAKLVVAANCGTLHTHNAAPGATGSS